MSLSAGNLSADSVLHAAYLHEDMQVWKQYLETNVDLIHEYGYCGYIVDKDKEAAKPFVQRFRNHVEAQKKTLPPGHYEIFKSAVLVFELRLHESVHPVKAMSLAKEATQLAPNDPIVLSYYGTSLFYAPKPFGSKSEALKWFERAQKYFRHPKWKYCWMKDANEMYIRQCKEKIGAAK